MAVHHPLIVVADDDPDVRDLLADRFAQAGYDVDTAADGAKMIELLERDRIPAGIFVDLMMPGIVGHSVLDYVLHEPRLADVPVAIVSGSPELAPAGWTLFQKPVRFAKLLEFVMGRGRARQ
jgi:CheY-like chemotaxis protein